MAIMSLININNPLNQWNVRNICDFAVGSVSDSKIYTLKIK